MRVPRILTFFWFPAVIAAAMAGATATSGEPAQLRFKAPRSLPPVGTQGKVQQASAELPVSTDAQLQRDFDEYIAGLPPDTANDHAPVPEEPRRLRVGAPEQGERFIRLVDVPPSPRPAVVSDVQVPAEPPRGLNQLPFEMVVQSVTQSPIESSTQSFAVAANKAEAKGTSLAGTNASSCGPHGGRCYNHCRRLWVQGDYLLWWTKGDQLPPLVTSSVPGTLRADAGVLNRPGTSVLFGNENVNNEERSGARLIAGYWLDPCCRVGIEGDFVGLEGQANGLDLTSSGDPILARPFLNVITDMQDSELIAFPGVVVGRINVSTSSDLHTGGIRLRKNICCRNWCIPECLCGSCCPGKSVAAGFRVDWLAGYRYLRLDDDLRIGESLVSTDTGGVLAQGTMIEVLDDFQTDNEFHGGELGLASEYRRGRWGMRLLAKVALGNNREVVRINGATTVTVPGLNPAMNTGGILALGTNSGTFSQDEFAVLPEASLSLYYQVTCNVRATVGYNFLYLSHVVRPGDQIDLGLNPTQFPPGTLAGAARPAFAFHDTDFWAQGLNIGLEIRR